MQRKTIIVLVLMVGIAAAVYKSLSKLPVSAQLSGLKSSTNETVDNASRDTETLSADNSSEQSLESDRPGPAVFKSVDDYVVQRVAPALDAKFTSGAIPMGYVRHRIVEVDVEELQRELHKSLQASEEGQTEVAISIPLFEDRIINTVIRRWDHGNFGVHVARGSISTETAGDLSVKFRFDANDNMQSIINAPDKDYRVESTSMLPYYVVFESTHVDAAM